MKAKIDVERFVASLIKYANETSSAIRLDDLIDSLEDQGLTCKDGGIVEISPQSKSTIENKDTIKPDSPYGGGWTINASIADSIEGD